MTNGREREACGRQREVRCQREVGGGKNMKSIDGESAEQGRHGTSGDETQNREHSRARAKSSTSHLVRRLIGIVYCILVAASEQQDTRTVFQVVYCTNVEWCVA